MGFSEMVVARTAGLLGAAGGADFATAAVDVLGGATGEDFATAAVDVLGLSLGLAAIAVSCPRYDVLASNCVRNLSGERSFGPHSTGNDCARSANWRAPARSPRSANAWASLSSFSACSRNAASFSGVVEALFERVRENGLMRLSDEPRSATGVVVDVG